MITAAAIPPSHLRPPSASSGAPAVVLALALLAPAAQAQAPSPSAERFGEEVTVDVVNVEVWVTDRDGNPVTGLSRDDFELLEDGAPVTISHFAAVDDRTAPAGAPDAAAAGPRAAPAAGASATDDPEAARRLVVFVDDWNLRPEDRVKVLDDLRTFVREEAGPGVSVMVVLHDGSVRVVQPFTHDPADVARTFDAIEKRAPSGVQARDDRRSALETIREAFTRAIDSARAGGGTASAGKYGGTDPCSAYWGEMENAAHNYAAATAGQVERSLGALTTVTDFLAGLPGQKALLYVGDGMEALPGEDLYLYLAQLCPARQSEVTLAATAYDLTGGFRYLTARANAHGVTFFSLEAEGPGGGFDMSIQGGGTLQPARQEQTLVTTIADGVGDGAGHEFIDRVNSFGITPEVSDTGGATLRPSAALERLRAGNLEGPLFTMAHETGGRAILNAIDFAPELERVSEDLHRFYSLGFVPSHLGDDRTHTLEVKVRSKGLTVRHRSSYRDKPLEVRYVERIFAAARMGVEDNPLAVRLEMGDAVTAGGTGRLAVPLRIWVPLDRLALVAREGGPPTGELRVMLSSSDGKGGMTPVRQKMVPVAAAAGTPGATDAEHMGEKLVEVQLELPPGEHMVALGVRDEVGGDVSYLRYRFQLDAVGAVPVAHREDP